MSPVTLFLICIAAIFLIGTFGEVVFTRTRVPDVIWLILVGIFIGPVLGIVTRATLLGIAPYFSALTLVFVLFEGGSRLDLGATLPGCAAFRARSRCCASCSPWWV